MKHRAGVLLFNILIAVCWAFPAFDAAFAQDDQSSAASSGSTYKIGVVDRKKVFDNYTRQKEEFTKLEGEVKQMQAEIDALSKKVEDARDEYEANKDTMSEEERVRLEEQIRSDAIEYQTRFKGLQTTIDTRYARLIKQLKSEIDEAVREIGNEGNYHLIIEGDPKSPSGVIYFASVIDVTPKVISKLNGAAAPE